MIKCRIRKVEVTEDAEYPINENGINVGYSRESILAMYPKVGECFYFGHLRTSTIKEILSYDKLRTVNSIYKIEYLDVEGLFVNSDKEENISEFFKCYGLYEIENKQYVVGRLNDGDIIPSTEEAWKNRQKVAFSLKEFMGKWYDASLVNFKDRMFDENDGTWWIDWKEQKIGIDGKLKTYSK